MSDDKVEGPIRVNASDEKEREVVTFLRAQHLPGVDIDDEAAVALDIEQSRLLLFGAGGLIVFISTQLFNINRAVCLRPLYCAMLLLVLALLGSWIALTMSANFRRDRVNRRYAMFNSELNHQLGALRRKTSPDPKTINRVWADLIKAENEKRQHLFYFRVVTLCLASAGIAFALWAVVATIDPVFCWGATTITGLQPPPTP